MPGTDEAFLMEFATFPNKIVSKLSVEGPHAFGPGRINLDKKKSSFSNESVIYIIQKEAAFEKWAIRKQLHRESDFYGLEKEGRLKESRLHDCLSYKRKTGFRT